MLTFCKRCVMPHTKPDLKIDAEGICSACRSFEQRREVDWASANPAAESLFAAGEQLEKMGNRAGATTIYRELLQKHPKHALAPLAEQRLSRIVPQAPRPPTK